MIKDQEVKCLNSNCDEVMTDGRSMQKQKNVQLAHAFDLADCEYALATPSKRRRLQITLRRLREQLEK